MAVFPEAEIRRVDFVGFLADINARGVPSTVECLRSDNGTELVESEFVEMLHRRGIRRECTPVGSSKHDGLVERRRTTTLELAMASCLKPSRLFGASKMPLTRPL